MYVTKPSFSFLISQLRIFPKTEVHRAPQISSPAPQVCNLYTPYRRKVVPVQTFKCGIHKLLCTCEFPGTL